MKEMDMGSVLNVVQDETSGDWLVCENDAALATYARFRDARAYARAILLERGKGSVVVFTPSGRLREKLQIKRADGRLIVQGG
jgi:hypothetical protein